MNKIMSLVLASGLALTLSAGIEIKSPRLDALYRCGEKASFSVSVTDGSGLMKTGEVAVVLDNFGSGVISSNVYSLAEGNPIKVKGSLGAPGFLRVRAYGAGGSAVWSVAYEPEKLRPVTPTPADFDAFWSAARQRLAAEVPLDAQMTKVPERCTEKFDFYRISFATFGRRVHGYMSIPTDSSRAPFPVEFQVAAAGFGSWTNDVTGEPDRIRVFFSVYPFEPDWRWNELGLQAKYDAMNRDYDAKYGCGYYSCAGSGVSREEYFYYPVILGIDRAIDWLAARPEVNAKAIHYQGTSQGGGMGLALTGLNKHISRAVFFVPAMTDTLAGDAGLQSGWPQPLKSVKDESARSVVRKVMPYFDGASFATRITCPVRYVVGLADTTCAPHCTWATYNALASTDKQIFYGIGMGHGVRNAFYTAMLHWLNGAPAKDPSVVSLTFDDDIRDFATDVSPLLVKYGWKGIFNVITDRVGRDETQLTWDDIRAIRDAGHEIANHSFSHPHLKELVKEGNTNELRRQIVESRDILARELGRPPAWFCLPFNSGDETVRAMVVEAGMRSYGPGRKNYGAHQPPWTDNGVYVTLLKDHAEGKKPDDIMVHGVRAGRGFRPFDSAEQYEKHLQELQLLERDGFIRVLPYSAAKTNSFLRVRFLGTGAADWRGVDERGERRRRSSVLIDNRVLIDLTSESLEMIPTNACPEVIFYTHSHCDHFDPAAVKQLGVKRAYVHESWYEFAKAHLPFLETIPLKTGESVAECGVLLTSCPASHATGLKGELASIYLIEKGETRLLYATDTSGIPALAARLAGIDAHDRNGKGITALVMEATMGVGRDDDYRIFTHSSVATVAQIVRVLEATGRYHPRTSGQKVYLTHMARTLHGTQSETERAVPSPLAPAYDGLEVSF